MAMEKKKQRHCYGPVPKTTRRFAKLLGVLLISVFPVLNTGLAFDYGDALKKSLLYFESQRSGRLPYNQRVAWRHHSGLTDGLEQGVDLVGGYYDAGDHVKFGLPMAFTVTMLSWTVIEFQHQIAIAGELEHALEAIKWGTDYFIKAHTSPNVLWAEKTNPHYSHLLLHHAQQLFEFGDKYRGKYDENIGVVKSYYASVSGYKDELLWGALWLYKATDNEIYLEYVINKAQFFFGGIGWAMTEFSWDVKYAGLQIMASKVKRHLISHMLFKFKILGLLAIWSRNSFKALQDFAHIQFER
ncbi:ENDO-14-BETA-GLUCANASE [Salix viminalis]|uniref:cellulase n=1 Tax=Salix viminalis TaxID=40686 RepID=A0A9Q0NRQ0_SALVM|nr:ENDO-14-BETA-GLUCANASE [Salix viminalis]